MSAVNNLCEIPQPPTIPFLGNVHIVDKGLPLNSFLLLVKQYGPIYKLNFLGTDVIVVANRNLVHQVSDESKFGKNVNAVLEQVRNGVGDGLFTAYPDEPNWGIAHRILMPAFGPASIRDMWDDMVDLCDQLTLKWARFGPDQIIDPSNDFIRLGFDTVSLCAMNHRLNSFYQKELPDSIGAMANFLTESGIRAWRSQLVQATMVQTNNRYNEDIKLLKDLTNKVIGDRKANPIAKSDLLGKMLNGKDPKTGQGLSDENICNNLVTFLIAGHETISAALSFALYCILKNPSAYSKLRAEVDTVLGDRPIQLDDIPKLPYLTAVVRETLRQCSPITQRSAQALEDTVLENGGKRYAIKKGQNFSILNAAAHMDASVYGEDVEEFKPERMMDEKFEALPPNAWQPFGNGIRDCIGRPFAWQEMHIVLASVVQRFDMVLYDPSYTLEIKQILTIKPWNFHVKATARPGKRYTTQDHSMLVPNASQITTRDAPVRFYVAYGSNTGSCEYFAHRIASVAQSKGFASKLSSLDAIAGRIPTDGPLIIVTASFEGEPPNNARHFVQQLKDLPKQNDLANVHYAVFGCGDRDWINTYQRIPGLCDDLLEKNGASRIFPRGEADAGGPSFFEEFDEWESKLWAALNKKYGEQLENGIVEPIQIELCKGTERAQARGREAALGKVIENRILTKGSGPVKCHIEISLPDDMTYQAGDYLSILPNNPAVNVRRVLKRFNLSEEQEVTISSKAPTTLPTGKPVAIVDLLKGYVELAQPATKKNMESLISLSSGEVKAKLNSLLSSFREVVLGKQLSVLDILELHPNFDLPFAMYLSMLPPMQVRQYPISSSPLWNPTRVTLTVNVLDAPLTPGNSGHFLGVASIYLSHLQTGDLVKVSVRSSNTAFRLPEDPTVPIIMFAMGNGIAPMRGFLQERAIQAASGRAMGEALLFFSCGEPEQDYLYLDAELEEWIKNDIVTVLPAFLRASDQSDGCKYIQDRVWKERERIAANFEKGAKLYTCVSGAVANGIKDVCIKIAAERFNISTERATDWLSRFQQERFVTNVFN